LQTVAGDDGKDGNDKKQDYRPTDVLLTVFNGLLAAFTLALVIVGGLQARRLRQTVEATKEAADAAKQSAETASSAFYAANRPWVLVSDFSIEEEVGKKLISYKVYNVGPVPAVLRGRNEVSHIDIRIPDDAGFAATPIEGLVLQPNSSNDKGYVTFNFVPPISSSAQWLEIESGQKTLFFLGDILYAGPLRLSPGGPLIYKTGFGAWHKGVAEVFGDTRTFMRPLTDPKYSYVK
jgi:hypothetical protein